MTAVTAIIAALGSLMAFLMRPAWAVSAFSAVLFLYPQQLTLNIGTIKFSTCRIIILALLFNLIIRQKVLKNVRWDLMDTVILIYFFATAGSYMLHAPLSVVVQQKGGSLFDTFLPYFAIRLAIRNKEQLISYFKMMLLIALPLAILGAYQSQTGHNPVGFMEQYFSWGKGTETQWLRHGFYRATVTFGNYIAFGMYFAALAPIALGLGGYLRKGKIIILPIFGIMTIGVISTMSSGPLFSLGFSLLMLAVFPFRRFWPVMAVLFLALVIFTEVFSNRHFYHVLTRLALPGSDAYYRIGLIDKALGGGMDGHWIAGYGYVGVGGGYISDTGFDWGEYDDLTNIYIKILAQVGLIALIPYLALNFLYYRRLYQAARKIRNTRDAWMIWCFASALAGWNVAMMTVAPLAQVATMIFMLIGLCCNMPAIFARQEACEAGLAQISVSTVRRYRTSWVNNWLRHHA